MTTLQTQAPHPPWCAHHQGDDGAQYCETERRVIPVQDNGDPLELRYATAEEITPELIEEMGGAPGGPIRGDGRYFWILSDAFTISGWGETGTSLSTIQVATQGKSWGLSLEEAEQIANALLDLIRLAQPAASRSA